MANSLSNMFSRGHCSSFLPSHSLRIFYTLPQMLRSRVTLQSRNTHPVHLYPFCAIIGLHLAWPVRLRHLLHSSDVTFSFTFSPGEPLPHSSSYSAKLHDKRTSPSWLRGQAFRIILGSALTSPNRGTRREICVYPPDYLHRCTFIEWLDADPESTTLVLIGTTLYEVILIVTIFFFLLRLSLFLR